MHPDFSSTAPRLAEWHEAAIARGDGKNAAIAGLWSLLFLNLRNPMKNPLLHLLHTRLALDIAQDLLLEIHGEEWIKEHLKPCLQFLVTDAKTFISKNKPHA